MRFMRRGPNSRVASRVLLSFVFAGGLPLLVMAGTSYYLITDRLQVQAVSDARGLAKDFGMGIFDRLKFINDELHIIARSVDRTLSPLPDLAGLDLQDRSRGLFYLVPGETVIGSAVLGAREREAIFDAATTRDRRKPALLAIGPPGHKRLFLLVAAPAQTRRDGWYGTELSSDHLWNSTGIAERIERVCVLDPMGTPVYCNHADHDDWLSALQKMGEGHTQSAALRHDSGETLLTASWSLFLKPHYQFDSWMVVVGVPESLALASIRSFDRLFFGSAVLALLVSSMLGRRMIRSNLKPLATLTKATEKLSAGDFAHRVRIESADEFQQLGDAFDQMAARVGSQFDELRILARLDRALQNAQSVEAAIGAAADALQGLVGHSGFALLCNERWNRMSSIAVRPFDSAEVIWFDQAPRADQNRCIEVNTATAEEALRERVGAAAGDQLHVHPVLNTEQVGAEIVLREALSHDLAAVSRIGDVLGIALERLVMQGRMFHQANHDWLTDLPNRSRLLDLFDQSIRGAAEGDCLVGMLLLGLDRFKQVNDSLGHRLGDQLLAAVGRRLRAHLPSEVVLSRLSGDQFLIMLTNAESLDLRMRLEELAEQIGQELHRQFDIGLRKIRLTATMGAALYPEDGRDFGSMLQSLDAASYAAKSSLRGGLLFVSSGMREALAGRMDLEQALMSAVAHGELVLHYQPVVEAETRKVRYAEALMRWERPGVGLVMPGSFIELAEQSGLIREMGHWAIRQVCRQMQAWRSAGLVIESVTVNVSSVQLGSDQLIDQVAAALQETGLPPAALTLEVTETALIGQFEEGVRRLKRLRALGVQILIDDFGTGYASFKYLKMLPVDGLKIDRLFIKDLPDSPRDAAIIQAVVSLADASGFKIVAEGIETEAQAAYLRAAGISNLQGFLFDRGLPQHEFETRLQRAEINPSVEPLSLMERPASDA